MRAFFYAETAIPNRSRPTSVGLFESEPLDGTHVLRVPSAIHKFFVAIFTGRALARAFAEEVRR